MNNMSNRKFVVMVFKTIGKIGDIEKNIGNVRISFESGFNYFGQQNELVLYVYYSEFVKREITYNDYRSADLSYERRMAPTIEDGKYYQTHKNEKVLFYIKEKDGVFDLYDTKNNVLFSYKKGDITTEYAASPFLSNVSNMFSKVMKIVYDEYDICVNKIRSGELYDKESFDKAFECMNIELVKINNKL